MKENKSGKNVVERVCALLRGTIEDLGYILWDVEYKKEGSDYNLIITIDREGEEVTLDDCVKVTDAINPLLDEADPIPDSYCLEVSSAGLERDLKRAEHFEKYLGREVEVRLFAPTDSLPKLFVAKLLSYGDSFSFGFDEKTAEIEKSKVALIKTIVNYSEIFKNN